jgi:hypothetical protein
MNCRNCGAPVNGSACTYCGTRPSGVRVTYTGDVVCDEPSYAWSASSGVMSPRVVRRDGTHAIIVDGHRYIRARD